MSSGVRRDECSLPVQAEQRTDKEVRGDIWLLASCRLINWSHAETKGDAGQRSQLLISSDAIWGRIYSSMGSHISFKICFLCVLSPPRSVYLALRYRILSRGCTRYHSPRLFPSLSQSLSICLFLSDFVSPLLRSSEHLHKRENIRARCDINVCLR